MSTQEELTLIAPPDTIPIRLDRWLVQAMAEQKTAEQSRSALQRWIKEGLVQVDGHVAKANHKVEAGQVIQVTPPPTRAVEQIQPEAIPLQIVYEDAHLIIVNKAAGMVVHPAPGHPRGTLVNAIMHHCPDIKGVGGERRPGIVHRLDKETSGLIVVAKDDQTHRFLQAQFQERTVYKEYLALLEGIIEPEKGRIAAPLGRHPRDRKRQAVLPADPLTGISAGRDAVTEYYTLGIYSTTAKEGHLRSGASAANFTLVRAVLHTGRTHQIRVHFAWCKHPVVGDTVYGYQRQRLALGRHFLHAHKLRLKIPAPDGGAVGRESIEREFKVPLPIELQKVLDQLD